MVEIKVISYNVHSCVGSDGIFSVDRIADVLLSESPAIVCLQEIESNQQVQQTRLWSSVHSIDQPRSVASQIGLDHVSFAPAIKSVATSSIKENHDVPYAEGSFGIATISMYPILESRVHRYARYQGKTLRNALACLILLPDGAKIWVVNTHLGCHHGTEQYEQTKDLVRFMHSLGSSSSDTENISGIILCGDLNSPPFFRALGLIKRAGFVDTWELGGIGSSRGCTFPAGGEIPGLPSLCSICCCNSAILRLDYIFFKENEDGNERIDEDGLVMLRCAYVMKGANKSGSNVFLASDHLPICSIFDVKSSRRPKEQEY